MDVDKFSLPCHTCTMPFDSNKLFNFVLLHDYLCAVSSSVCVGVRGGTMRRIMFACSCVHVCVHVQSHPAVIPSCWNASLPAAVSVFIFYFVVNDQE